MSALVHSLVMARLGLAIHEFADGALNLSAVDSVF